MRKIPSLFLRDFGGNPALVTRELNPLCGFVFEGATPSIKRDGTACFIRGGKMFKRYDAKSGKPAPAGFEPCQEPDEKTGHWPGWVPIGPDDKWHCWWIISNRLDGLRDGTYELCGPKVQDNPEGFAELRLIEHGSEILYDVPQELTFDNLSAYLASHAIEGIVWKEYKGAEMCKTKRSDFGYQWPIKRA